MENDAINKCFCIRVIHKVTLSLGSHSEPVPHECTMKDEW
jgi:hypothetical protein